MLGIPHIDPEEEKCITKVLTNPKSTIYELLDHPDILINKSNGFFSEYFDLTKIRDLIKLATQSTMPINIKPTQNQLKTWPYIASELIKVDCIHERVLAEIPSSKYSPSNPKLNKPIPNEKPFWLLDTLFLCLENKEAMKNTTQLGYFANMIIFLMNSNGATMIRYIEKNKLLPAIIKYIEQPQTIEIIKCFFNCNIDNKQDSDTLVRDNAYISILDLLESNGSELYYENVHQVLKSTIESDYVDYNVIVKHLDKLIQPIIKGSAVVAIYALRILTTFILKIKTIELLDPKLTDQTLYTFIAKLISKYTFNDMADILKFFNAVFSVNSVVIKDPEPIEILGKSFVSCLHDAKVSSPLLSIWLIVIKSFAVPHSKNVLMQFFNVELLSFLSHYDYDESQKQSYHPIICEVTVILFNLRKAKLIDKLDANIKSIYSRYICETEDPLYTEEIKCNVDKKDVAKVLYNMIKPKLIEEIRFEELCENLDISHL